MRVFDRVLEAGLRAGLAAQSRITNQDRGASAVEYALLVAGIALVVIVAISALGNNISGLFNKAASSVAP